MQTVSYMQLKDFIVRKKNMVLESCEKHVHETEKGLNMSGEVT